MIILNIGLLASENHYADGAFAQGSELPMDVVLNALNKHLGGVSKRYLTVSQSATEKTLVVGFSTLQPLENYHNAIHALAVELQQDCIAAFDAGNGKGELIGEFSADWVAFNPEYFLVC